MTDKTTVDNKFTFKTESTLAIYLQIPSFKRLPSIFLTVKHVTIKIKAFIIKYFK